MELINIKLDTIICDITGQSGTCNNKRDYQWGT